MSDQNKRITKRVLEEMFDQGNLDATDELIHPEFVNHEAPPGNPQGPEGLRTGQCATISARPCSSACSIDPTDEFRPQEASTQI
jgi:hypothetical protein